MPRDPGFIPDPEFFQIRDDHVSAMGGKSVGLPDAVETHDQAEASGSSGFHTGQRIFTHDGPFREDVHTLGGSQKGIGVWFASQVKGAGIPAIHHDLEKIRHSRGLNDGLAVFTGRDHGGFFAQ